ncbi:hypothetical protein [Nonomuraea sp. 10N515B]|uniref:hypothetical protein n=1 Tax=Nonomuraea sp. 10N515B TaxID=3457422 RepID=UPI003FCD4B0C
MTRPTISSGDCLAWSGDRMALADGVAGDAGGAAVWISVLLVALSTLAGAWLARRNSARVVGWLAVSSAVMLVIAVTDMLPDAWGEAAETGVPLWLAALALAVGFLVLTYLTRKGCACPTQEGPRGGAHAPGRHRRLKEAVGAALFGGMGTAAALTTHRAIEGSTLALSASVVVVAALVVHYASEGLALAILIDMAGQRLAPWLVVACVSPALGVLVAVISPLPERLVPILLALVTGVLLRTAFVGLKLAAARQADGRLSKKQLATAAVIAIAAGTLVAAGHRHDEGGHEAEGGHETAAGTIQPSPAAARTPMEASPAHATPSGQVPADLAAGRMSISQVLARTDAAVEHLAVGQVLQALPGYGPDTSRKLLGRAGISPERRVGEISRQQRRRLLQLLTG